MIVRDRVEIFSPCPSGLGVARPRSEPGLYVSGHCDVRAVRRMHLPSDPGHTRGIRPGSPTGAICAVSRETEAVVSKDTGTADHPERQGEVMAEPDYVVIYAAAYPDA